MAYSHDFRKKVLDIRERENLSIACVAERFNVGIASVVRWLKQIERKPQGFRKSKLDLDQLRQDIFDYPDAYQAERAERFGVSRNSIRWGLKKLGVTYKKTLKHPKSNEDEGQKFQEKIDAYKAENRPLIYIDESGFAHDMPRTHGYAPIGQRCFGTQDWNAKGRTNVIGAPCWALCC